jgi:hypothetical protein
MPLLLAAVVGLGVLASGSAAHRAGVSSCTPHNSIGTSSFNYVICDLPDIDQVRQQTASTPGLPGDGYSYCVPTSTMDALAYFASHGVPALRPGSKDWTSPANYNEMSADIKALGDLMGTTPSGGTTDGYFAGLETWLSQTQPGVIPPIGLVTSYLWVTAPDASFAPDLRAMATDAAAGDIVVPNVIFMRYEQPPTRVPAPKQWFMVGGHVVAMASAKSPSTIGLHDPANPLADHASQSPYAEEKYTLTQVTSRFGYLDDHGKDVSFQATLPRVDDYFIDSVLPPGSQTFLWGYTVLQPETVTTWSAAKVTLVSPVRPGEPVESVRAAGGQPVVDLALDPDGARNFYATQGSSTIWQLNTANGTSTPFAKTDGSAGLVAFAGRTQTLFALTRSRLTAFDRTGRAAASIALSEQVDAVAVDQATSRLLALSAESGRLRVYDAKLRLRGTVQLPQRALAGSGRISIALRGQVVYVHRDDRPGVALFAVKGFKLAGARAVPLTGAVRPEGLAVDDAGRIFVQSGGKLAEYSQSGKLLTSSPFNGLAAGTALVVNRNFSNADVRSLPFRDSPIPRRRQG